MVASMTVLLSRWQFAATTIYHFLFVPVTIGLGLIVAILQTAAYRSGDDRYERVLDFFGKLFLINFAIGVVTGIVQEFQFGMNWSAYSAYVGNIFGPPLAIEGLLAFFMESTFLGVWLFGKDRVPRRVHLASIWLVSIGTMLSAAFILAANSWMQHPVGYRIDPATHQAVMTNFWAILTNELFLVTLFHTLLASFLTGSALVLGISLWQYHRSTETREVFAAGARVSLIVMLISALLMGLDGHIDGQVIAETQPMKLAAGEALYNTSRGASESILTIGNLHDKPIFSIGIPHVLSLLATDHWNGVVQGINQLQAAMVRQYGPGSYIPPVALDYWSFRIMAGIGAVIILIALWGGWLLYHHRLEQSRWFAKVALWTIPLPFIANTTGWIYTETGRQPWIVYGLLKTSQGASHLSPWSVGITLVGFTVLYGILAVVDISLMVRYGRRSLEPGADTETEHEVGSLIY
ncbi:cytochrome bd ubiquinol oxidase subunit I [Acidimicrobium ferrooxidans DSM 10331]|uniref:Cytochrome bd ubiquinol oxidase subunit I n=1 Tax=Acidimicrobium ferrooxidans (strain DSM 10331 / JCM 15462 / NBRC 103882 / ICP) TaxID=525909 RepID=C7M392_ACIFD|nr:cytochrome ubiquinol oxidase subunit I [Acidimicrobium ferrooxidans]ACU53486.1 cytochrome bd ubiquinol oxidase subunit I [Acidimicrobium ferrooxidans DSM 10331]